MPSKAWDSSLRLPGLIVESRTVSNRRDCRDVGPTGGGSELPGPRDALDVAAQPIRPQAVGFAGQRQHRQAAAVGSAVPLSAHALPTTHVQRAADTTCWLPIWPQGGALRRAGARGGGGFGRPAGSRMMARLSLPWSRDTMLRVLRRGAPAAVPPPPARRRHRRFCMAPWPQLREHRG